MIIDEAIRIKEQGQRLLTKEPYPKFKEADNLSIEALKLVVKRRRFAIPVQADLLPGETKE